MADHFNASGEQRSPARWTGERGQGSVDAIDRAARTPRRPGQRAAHRHGFAMRGTFRGKGVMLDGLNRTAEDRTMARRLTELSDFEPFAQTDGCDAVVRFSNMSAKLDQPDIMGMATKIVSGSGEMTDLLAMSAEVFIAAHPRDFIAFLDAHRNRLLTLPRLFRLVATGQVWLGPLLKAMRAQRVNHGNGLSTTYHGIQTFRLVRGTGSGLASSPMRYRWLPHSHNPAGYYRDFAPLAAAQPSQLGTMAFDLELLVRPPNALLNQRDRKRLDDPRFAWSEPYEVLQAGTLTLTEVITDQTRGLAFDPTVLAPGIALGDSPLFGARQSAYTISHVRRSTELGAGPVSVATTADR